MIMDIGIWDSLRYDLVASLGIKASIWLTNVMVASIVFTVRCCVPPGFGFMCYGILHA